MLRHAVHRPRNIAGLAIMAILLMATSGHAVVVDLNTTFDEPVSSGLGGRTLLVEEITATWCPTCAEIDPELAQVADGHGSRITLLALHPTDGDDAFQPPASQHRIDRLRLSNPDLEGSTPTFVVEGGEQRKGYDAWSEVQGDILDTELARQQTSTLEFEVVKTATGCRANIVQATLLETTGTQLTFLVMQHQKSMPSGALNPGGEHRDRVVVGLAECSMEHQTITTSIGLDANVGDGCDTDFSIEFADMDSWSVVLIHEPAPETIDIGDRVQTHGVVELAFRDRSTFSEEQSISATLLLFGCGALALASIVRKKQ